MKNLELHIEIIGVLLIVLASVHVIFPKYFRWKEELGNLSLINRQIMYVHTFFIALLLLLMGMLCMTSSTEIIQTALGKKLALGLCIFWGTRLFIQFFGYSSSLWRGKRLETTIHIVFALFWTYLSAVFGYVYWH